MRTARAVAALAVLVLLIATAFADVPTKINYQVMLTDDSDEPLADQAVTLVFRIYDAPSGGTVVFSETHNTATNSIGVVSVMLGSIQTLSPYIFDAPMWMEVDVDGETLSPRREFVSSPYALYAQDSAMLGRVYADDYALEEDLFVPGTINTPSNPVDWTMLKNVPAGFADGDDAEGGGAGDGHSLDASDGDPIDALYVDEDGVTHIGGGASAGRMKLHPSGSQVNHLAVAAGGLGGELYVNDETGAIHTSIQPDVDGTGGFFEVVNGRGGSAFYVDGNHLGGSDGAVVISGSGSVTSFDTALSGDDAVNLPASAVSGPEILDEPGVSGSDAVTMFELTGNPEPDVLLSSTITVPGPGYVLAMATAEAQADRVAGIVSAYFGISSVLSFMDQEMLYGESDGTSAGPWNPGISVHMLFAVGAAGPHTFYFQANEVAGTWRVYERDLTLVYFPTYYGAVSRSKSGPAAGSEVAASATGDPLTEANIAADRDASVAANNARIERELAEIEARVSELRAMMGNRK